jgi:acyl-coenzyme A synthetase/AMP-(fatty) acid ligase
VNLVALLDEHPFAADEPLVHTENGSVTRGEVDALVAERAARLTDCSVQPGQPVAVLAANTPETIGWMFATWRTGGVYVPINPLAPDAERSRAIEATEPAVVVDREVVATRDRARTHAPSAAFVLWTSGTTGRPKAVVHTHDAYVELLDRVLGPLRGKPRDPAQPPMPNLIPVALALNAGMYNCLFALRAGSSIVLMERFRPDAFATLVARHGIRSTVLPPAAMVMLVDEDSVTDLAPLRYVRSITAPLSPLQARRFTEKFAGTFVLNGYGQAEIGEVIGWTAQDARDNPDKIGAVGRPHPGVDVRVVDDGGDSVGTDEVGHLEVRPPNRTEMYAGGEAIDDRVTADGFWRTGDLGRIDADGFVWISGRAGDVINRGGNKVFPEDVEETLRLHPLVADAAVVGRADDRLGEVPVAYVELAAGATVDAANVASELEARCRRELTAYKVPVSFEVIDALPRNDAGKVVRNALR